MENFVKGVLALKTGVEFVGDSPPELSTGFSPWSLGCDSVLDVVSGLVFRAESF